jgi:hypothetical protein
MYVIVNIESKTKKNLKEILIMTNAQLKKISDHIRVEIKNSLVIINKAKTTSSAYIDVFIEDWNFTIRFASHSVPYNIVNKTIIDKYDSIRLDMFDEQINFNLPSMSVSVDELMPYIDEAIKYIKEAC